MVSAIWYRHSPAGALIHYGSSIQVYFKPGKPVSGSFACRDTALTTPSAKILLATSSFNGHDSRHELFSLTSDLERQWWQCLYDFLALRGSIISR